MMVGRTDAQKKELLLAITKACEDAIDAPRQSVRVWINEFAPSEFMIGGELAAKPLNDARIRVGNLEPPDDEPSGLAPH